MMSFIDDALPRRRTDSRANPAGVRPADIVDVPAPSGGRAARPRQTARAALSIFCACLTIAVIAGCAKPPSRQYYLLNYVPPQLQKRSMPNPYAAVIRLREFSIEEAYNRSQIVYRLNPYELRYYNYRSWAVKPTRMITDLFFKHLSSVQIVSSVVRRFDEGRKPDFELTGFIEALEEYDSEDMLFAHIAIRLNMTRISDGAAVYSRLFDLRKRVYRRETEFVVKEMSQIMEYIFIEAIVDIDGRLAAEFGLTDTAAPEFAPVEEPTFITDIDSLDTGGGAR